MNRKQKNKENHWTTKVGKKIGGVLDKAFSNKKFKITLTVILLCVLFVFIVPVNRNLISVCLLIILLIIYLVLKKLEKK